MPGEASRFQWPLLSANTVVHSSYWIRAVTPEPSDFCTCVFWADSTPNAPAQTQSYPPPPPRISNAFVQATVAVGTVIILYII